MLGGQNAADDGIQGDLRISTAFHSRRTMNTSFMARHGLRGEDLIEVQVPRGAANNDFAESPDEWVRRWPAEEVWFARRGSASTGR